MSNKKKSPNSPKQQNHTNTQVSALLRGVIFVFLIMATSAVAVFYYGRGTFHYSSTKQHHLAPPTPNLNDHDVHTEQDIEKDIKSEKEESAAAVQDAISKEKSLAHKPIFYTGRNMSVAIFPEKNGKTTFWLGVAFHKGKDGASCDGGLSNSGNTALNHAVIGRDRIILNQPLDKKGLSSCRIVLNVHSNVITSSHEKDILKPGAKFRNSLDQMQASCAGQHGASCTFELKGSPSHPIMSRASLNQSNLARLASNFGSGEIDQLTAEMKRH